jgi:glucarate dehydratase
VVELQVEGGIVGIAEAPGGNAVTTALERARHLVVGTSAFAYRRLEGRLVALNPGCYAGIELACLDACGRGPGQRLCELVGGPVRDSVEFAAHLFYRYAADHPVILADPRLAALDSRGRGQRALDAWGEVRTTEAMAGLAEDFRKRWGFRVFKLKGGVLPPEVERESLEAMAARLGAGVPPLKGERMRVFFDAMRLETIEAAQVVVQSPKP